MGVRVTKKTILVALAGAPNVGKSTLFNLLTGLSQHVGNWPGKTVERKEGVHHHDGITLHLIDLPGTYSLTANSVEEQIARDYMLREKPDVVVVVVDAAHLERNLYLLSEVLELPSPVVLALNMVDVAEARGIRVEPEVLEAALGLPVMPLVATRGQGVEGLVERIEGIASGAIDYRPRHPELKGELEAGLEAVEEMVGEGIPAAYPRRWVALKLLEGDSEVTELVRQRLPEERWRRLEAFLRQREDAVVAIATSRYGWISRMVRAALVRPPVGEIYLTERLDRLATHPAAGLVILMGLLGLIFGLVYTFGAPLQELLELYVVDGAAAFVRQLFSPLPWWFSGLLADGVVGGAGMVLTFLPILLIFFIAMGLLEDVGYMARAALVMDRFMHPMGLHGKSFLPLCLGFGCNVPAVLGARIVESERARLLTMLVAPLVPCTARMAVLTLMAGAFFGRAAAVVSWGFVVFNLAMLALSGVIINRLLLGGERPAFIMELPLYHAPNWRVIGLIAWRRLIAFVVRAGTVILPFSTLIWALSAFPSDSIEQSLLGQATRWLEPLGGLLGLNWQMIAALFSSFIAKENAIATLAVLLGAEEGEAFSARLAGILSPAAAVAFLAVQMLFVPCVATVAALYQETASWRWTGFAVLFLLALSFAVGVLIYQGASAVGWGI